MAFQTAKQRKAQEELAATFAPGDRVTIEFEGPCTVVGVDFGSVIVKADSDGVELDASPYQLTRI
jgi:preprotein translocase subunit YajC